MNGDVRRLGEVRIREFRVGPKMLMQTSSALSNGLLYGAIAAGAPVGIMLLNCGSSERALTVTLIAMVLYANVAFFIAFCSHRQTSEDIASAQSEETPTLKLGTLFLRIIIGLSLAAYVGGLVFLLELSNMIEVYGGVYEYLTFDGADLPERYHYLAIYTMSGAAASAMAAGFIGTVLAPRAYGGRMVIRSAMMSSGLGFFIGGFTSAVPGLMATKLISEVVAYSFAIAVGSLSGIASAFVLRWQARRRDLRW